MLILPSEDNNLLDDEAKYTIQKIENMEQDCHIIQEGEFSMRYLVLVFFLFHTLGGTAYSFESAGQAKAAVREMLSSEGVLDDSYIYKEYEKDNAICFDTLVLSGTVAIKIENDSQEMLCGRNGRFRPCQEYFDNLSKRWGKKTEVPEAKQYEDPEELFEDIVASMQDGNLILFRQTVAGEAEENYGNEKNFRSWLSQIEGAEYQSFQSLDDLWLHGTEAGERVYLEGGYVLLKVPDRDSPARLRVMKLNDSWKIVED